MVIKLDTLRIKNLANLMKGVRTLEGMDVDTTFFSKEGIREDTLVYKLEYPTYTGLLLCIEGGFFFLRKERLYVGDYTDTDIESCGVDILAMPDGGIYTAHLILEDWTDSEFIKYEFEPSDYITYPESDVFTGSFIEACKYIIDFWMR